MMKVDRALKEVWGWKDEIYQENKGKSMSDFAQFIRQEAKALRKERRLKLKQKAARL